MRILVADDDRELGEILSFALTRAGYEVVRAVDGEQALELFAQAPPALVLLDSNMPKLDGLEVCQRLRAQSAVPIIMLTVRNAEDEIVRAFELGATANMLEAIWQVMPVSTSTPAPTAPWCRFALPPDRRVGSRSMAIAGTCLYMTSRTSAVPWFVTS